MSRFNFADVMAEVDAPSGVSFDALMAEVDGATPGMSPGSPPGIVPAGMPGMAQTISVGGMSRVPTPAQGIVGDIGVGLAAGTGQAVSQVGGAMEAVGNILPGALGRRVQRAGAETVQMGVDDTTQFPQPTTFAGQIAQSVPGLAAAIGAGAVTGGIGGLAVGAGMAGAQSGGQQYNDAKARVLAAGGTVDQARQVATNEAGPMALFSAATSVIPMGRYLGRFSPAVLNRAVGKVSQRPLFRILGDAAAEGSQEAAEELASMTLQTIAEDDPEAFRDWGTRLATAGAGGAILGGGVGSGLDIAGRIGGTRGVQDAQPAAPSPVPAPNQGAGVAPAPVAPPGAVGPVATDVPGGGGVVPPASPVSVLSDPNATEEQVLAALAELDEGVPTPDATQSPAPVVQATPEPQAAPAPEAAPEVPFVAASPNPTADALAANMRFLSQQAEATGLDPSRYMAPDTQEGGTNGTQEEVRQEVLTEPTDLAGWKAEASRLGLSPQGPLPIVRARVRKSRLESAQARNASRTSDSQPAADYTSSPSADSIGDDIAGTQPQSDALTAQTTTDSASPTVALTRPQLVAEARRLGLDVRGSAKVLRGRVEAARSAADIPPSAPSLESATPARGSSESAATEGTLPPATDLQQGRSSQDTPKYVKPTQASNNPFVGELYQARKAKDAAWGRVKALRETVKELGPRAGQKRLDLLKAESSHHDAVARERAALEQVEKRAAEVGETTVKQIVPPAGREAWEMTREEFSGAATDKTNREDYARAWTPVSQRGQPNTVEFVPYSDGKGGVVRWNDERGIGRGVIAFSDGKVTELAVQKEWRRKGIATALYREAAKRGATESKGSITPAAMSVRHKAIVEKAIRDGKPVPQAVLDQYPALAAKVTAPTETPSRQKREETTPAAVRSRKKIATQDTPRPASPGVVGENTSGNSSNGERQKLRLSAPADRIEGNLRKSIAAGDVVGGSYSDGNGYTYTVGVVNKIKGRTVEITEATSGDRLVLVDRIGKFGPEDSAKAKQYLESVASPGVEKGSTSGDSTAKVEPAKPLKSYEKDEAQYVADRMEQYRKSYLRGIAEKQAEIDARPKWVKESRAKIKGDATLHAWKNQLAQLEATKEGNDPGGFLQKFKDEYAEIVKKAISTGKEVPANIIESRPDFIKARTARERYDKGRHTSFANKSAAVHSEMQAERGYKVKQQDGTSIRDDHKAEIARGVAEVESAIGPLPDLFRTSDLTIAHTNGKYPFMRGDAGGLYHPDDKTVTVGVEVGPFRFKVRALAHELGHWLDYEAGSAKGKTTRLSTKSGKFYSAPSMSEAASRGTDDAGESALIREATNTINDRMEVRRLLRPADPDKITPEQKEERDVARFRLTPYWTAPREVWARLVEQYVANKVGKQGDAADSPQAYAKMPGWWTQEQFDKMRPDIERVIQAKLEFFRGDAKAEPAQPPKPKGSNPRRRGATTLPNDIAQAVDAGMKLVVAGGHKSIAAINRIARQVAAKLNIQGKWRAVAQALRDAAAEFFSTRMDRSRAGMAALPGGKQTDTPQFKAWFGDSKVVDAKGQPLVVYHGTRRDFDTFSPSSGGEFGSGIYFTSNKETAEMFGGFQAGDSPVRTVPVYLSMQNPLITNDRDIPRGAGVKKLIAKGYDGVIGTTPSGQVQYVVFRPEQIKSATGNSGAFSKHDPRISGHAINPIEETLDIARRVAANRAAKRTRELAKIEQRGGERANAEIAQLNRKLDSAEITADQYRRQLQAIAKRAGDIKNIEARGAAKARTEAELLQKGKESAELTAKAYQQRVRDQQRASRQMVGIEQRGAEQTSRRLVKAETQLEEAGIAIEGMKAKLRATIAENAKDKNLREIMRARVTELAKDYLPADLQGRMLVPVRDAKNAADVFRAIFKIEDVLLDRAQRNTVRLFKATSSTSMLKKLTDARRTQAKGIIAAAQADVDAIGKQGATADERRTALESLREKVQQLQTIYHEHRFENKIRVKGQWVDLAQKVRQLGLNLTFTAKRRGRDRRRPERLDNGIWQKTQNAGRTVLTPETAMMRLDGEFNTGDVATDIGYTQLADANLAFRDEHGEYLNALDQLAMDLGFDGVTDVLSRLGGRLGDATREKIDFKVQGVPLSLGQALDLYAASLDPETGALIPKGQRWAFRDGDEPFDLTPAQVSEIIGQIDDRYLQFHQRANGMLEAHFPDIQKAHWTIKGYEPPGVPNHWPRRRDTTQIPVDAKQNPTAELDFYMENAGGLKTRKQSPNVPLFLDDYATTLMQKAEFTFRSKHLMVPLYNARRLLEAPEVTTAIRTRFGKNMVDNIHEYMQDVAGVRRLSLWQETLAQWTRNYSRSLTQISPSSWAIQLSGIPRVAMERGGAEIVAKGIGGAFSPGTHRDMVQNSSWARTRYKTDPGALSGGLAQNTQQTASNARTAARAGWKSAKAAASSAASLKLRDAGAHSWDVLDKSIPALTDKVQVSQWFDGVVSRVAWSGMRSIATANGHDTAWVDKQHRTLMRRIANSGEPTEMAFWAAEVNRKGLTPLTAFTSDASKAAAQVYRAMHGTKADKARALSGLLASAAFAGVMKGLWEAGMGALRDDEDAEDKAYTKAVDRMTDELASLVPFADKVKDMVAGTARFNQRLIDAPLIGGIENATRSAARIANEGRKLAEGSDEADMDKALDAAFDLLIEIVRTRGIPTTPVTDVRRMMAE